MQAIATRADLPLPLARFRVRSQLIELRANDLRFTDEEAATFWHQSIPLSLTASGTGWATGNKTSNGRISTTAGTDKDLKTILELAKERGYKTGDVTTAELTDATPAVLLSHMSDRSCQGPQDTANCPQDKKSAGGPGSIAEQSIDHNHLKIALI
ncbi:hypothetical protein A6769_28645 [Nostoc punctiforme NIES-2108]|uniref:Uncharacterized protein n=1 Tax=Nostoc punctiforme NIES-2108 TaxID=1356359 RepID=A0A367R6L3_NOSPU|nr:hypothetical protein A6769_28645 [Nostoc punctiforme NIES-2108]